LAAAPRPPTLASPMAVRRITVVEAEKLQGFAENATLIHWPTAHRKGVDLAETIEYLIWHGYSAEEAEVLAQTPDGPRYRAIGNSWPTNVARWIGERMMMPGVWRDARRDHAA
jgi:DNA (cytosine-5)-methyltransferase 1